MHHPYSFPSLDPLTRLYPQESLRINTERWTLAHDYHRRRQSIVHQALWQPGIVCGLGVRVIEAPASTHSQFRDRRWIEIQPGLAIDIAGNPIVVDAKEDRTYRLAASTPLSGDRTIYVSLQYVDPDQLEIDVDSDRVLERFRFDQSSQPPTEQQIELCRITISSGEVELVHPHDPLKPGINELDLRHRPQAQLRPRHWVKILCPEARNNQSRVGLQRLLDALPRLHKGYGGELCVHSTVHAEELATATLLYVPDFWLRERLDDESRKFSRTLSDYLNRGGTLFVESENPAALKTLPQRLRQRDRILEPLTSEHLLRHTPFLFGSVFSLGGRMNQSVEIWGCDRIIVFDRTLPLAWQGTATDRTMIRNAQELGVNLLHFASYYQLLHNLMQAP